MKNKGLSMLEQGIHASTGCSAGGLPEGDPLIEDFITFKAQNQGRSQRTAEAYRDALLRLNAFLGGRSLLEAHADELELFTGPFLHKAGVLAVARRPYIASIREFYKWAAARKMIANNPAAGLHYPKTGRKLPRSMSLQSAESLMWAPNFNTFKGVRDAAILAVLVGCGLRVGGLVALNESQLVQVSHEGEIRTIIRANEKGEKERMIPVPREADMLLRLYLEHPELNEIDRTLPDGDRVLFVSLVNRNVPPHLYIGEERRMAARSIRDMIQAYGAAAGIDAAQLHPHAMRHLFGTELAEDDVDLLVRQDLMGHGDAKSTRIYTHLAARKKIKTVDSSGPLAKIKTPVSELLSRLQR